MSQKLNVVPGHVTYMLLTIHTHTYIYIYLWPSSKKTYTGGCVKAALIIYCDFLQFSLGLVWLQTYVKMGGGPMGTGGPREGHDLQFVFLFEHRVSFTRV